MSFLRRAQWFVCHRLFPFILRHDEFLIPCVDRLGLSCVVDEHLSRIRVYQNIMETGHATDLEHIVLSVRAGNLVEFLVAATDFNDNGECVCVEPRLKEPLRLTVGDR